MNAFLKLNKGMMSLPVPWRIWVMLLAFSNMVVPLFFIARLEAQVILGIFMASAMLMMVLAALTGFTRLLGLGHILWIPLLYFLWMRLPQIPAADPFGWYIRSLMAINLVSLIIDVSDVARYVAGERGDMVS